jgi:hypothetical protein
MLYRLSSVTIKKRYVAERVVDGASIGHGYSFYSLFYRPDQDKTIVHHIDTIQEHAQTESGCKGNTLRRERC